MTQLVSHHPEYAAPTATVRVPGGFLQLCDAHVPHLDRQLGYFGEGRYVCFHYEARGEEVVWNDGHSYGFGAGGWQAFLEHVAPLAHGCGVGLGAGGADATHVLVIDRAKRRAYLADRATALALAARQARRRDAAAA